MRAQEFIREDAPEGLVIKHKPTPTGGAAVEAYIGNREVGFVQFQRQRDGNYKAAMAHVSPSMRKQGIGREMYRYAREKLGFNIVPSDNQSDDAKAFWSRGGATNEESGVEEGLVEARNSLFAWIKQQFPTWPDYVLKDFLYQQAKGIHDQAELEDFLKRNKNDFGQVKWRLEQLPITMDIFTPKTQRMIISREGGSSNPFQVPKDAERHVQQSRMLQQTGVSKEPIIVAKLSNGYDLIEGWHRTIQHLKAFPEGYTAPAWVAYGATYTSESIEPGLAEGKVKLYTDPNYFGAEIDDAGFDSLPVVNIPANRLVGFEPDDKMNQPKSKANVEKIVAGLKKGDKLPPLLVRKYKNGYQVLDGHHRFWAYKLLGVKSIPSQIVPDEDIEEVGKKGVAENFADGRVRGKSRPGRVKRAGASCSGSVTSLRKRAKNSSGERAKMYHWCANMKSGKRK